MSNPLLIRLAEVWEDLAKRRFICTEAADASRAVVGGQMFGYFHEDNPEAVLGSGEGGHDFLVVDGYILDFWAAAYYGTPPIFDLSADAELVQELYGDRAKWESKT